MKKLLYTLLFCCFSGIAFSQEAKLYTTEEVATVPIMKGCELYSEHKDKSAMCLTQKINEELGNELTDVHRLSSTIKRFEANVSFIITKQGYLDHVEIISTNHEKFGNKVINSILRIAKRLNKNYPMVPASIEDGKPVDIQFELPVMFVLWN